MNRWKLFVFYCKQAEMGQQIVEMEEKVDQAKQNAQAILETAAAKVSTPPPSPPPPPHCPALRQLHRVHCTPLTFVPITAPLAPLLLLLRPWLRRRLR